MEPEPIRALDLFAGTGWGVACQLLAIEEDGVELMDEAVATRTANGMSTIYRDVWQGLLLSREAHELLYGIYTLLIGSPPCQTFSMAGNGAGRKALNEVIEAIRLHTYKDPAALLEFGEKHDMRTALVLTPLAYVYRDRPRLVTFEQVPTVLPVWEACAEVMREWGYDVKVAVLCAEQYGVPQTRKRAILVARLDGPVSLPTPTHSKYYSRTPEKLDPGVKKWVSMAEALGWTEDPSGRIMCPTNLRPHAGYRTGDKPSASLAFGHDSLRWITPEELEDYRQTGAPKDGVKLTTEEISLIQTYPAGGLRPEIEDWQWKDAPATTVAGDPRITAREHHYPGEQGKTALKLTKEEASALQTFPTGVVFRNGNQANASKRPVDAPAPTIMFGGRSNKVEWMDPELANDPSASGERVTVGQASVLQTYRRPFVWCGTKSKQFLQIGNAVPPLLAHAILSELIKN